MAQILRHPTVPDSPLARWDARWKLAGILVAIVGVAVLDHLLPAATAFGIALALLAAARLPGRWVRARLTALAMAALPFLLLLPLTTGADDPGWRIGPLHASERGLLAGLTIFCRCLAIGCFALVVLGSAPMHHTLAAAHRLRVPGLLILVTLLALRYAQVIGDELRRLRVALRVRGFRAKANRHSYHTLGHVVGAVLVRGADRADRVAHAMRCRGFDGRFHTLTAFRTTAADIISFVLLLAATAALVFWDRVGNS